MTAQVRIDLRELADRGTLRADPTFDDVLLWQGVALPPGWPRQPTDVLLDDEVVGWTRARVDRDELGRVEVEVRLHRGRRADVLLALRLGPPAELPGVGRMAADVDRLLEVSRRRWRRALELAAVVACLVVGVAAGAWWASRSPGPGRVEPGQGDTLRAPQLDLDATPETDHLLPTPRHRSPLQLTPRQPTPATPPGLDPEGRERDDYDNGCDSPPWHECSTTRPARGRLALYVRARPARTTKGDQRVG